MAENEKKDQNLGLLFVFLGIGALAVIALSGKKGTKIEEPVEPLETHTICEGVTCKEILGAGIDECELGFPCFPPPEELGTFYFVPFDGGTLFINGQNLNEPPLNEVSSYSVPFGVNTFEYILTNPKFNKELGIKGYFTIDANCSQKVGFYSEDAFSPKLRIQNNIGNEECCPNLMQAVVKINDVEKINQDIPCAEPQGYTIGLPEFGQQAEVILDGTFHFTFTIDGFSRWLDITPPYPNNINE